jgi:CubicO group peptidase (beta-lactamase class C family)
MHYRVLAAKAGFLLTLLAQTSCVSTAGPARANIASIESALDARIPALLHEYRIASVSVALIEHGGVVLEKAYGEPSAGVAATPATLFNLASLTKPVTIEVLLLLVAKGQLSLDEPMYPYWVDPDIASDPRHRELTLRMALNHRTGLPNWRGHSPDGKLRLTFDPGTAFLYSGEGFDYAAHYAEKKLGRPFEDLAQEEIFGPERMTRTSYSFREWMRDAMAIPLNPDGSWGNPQVQSTGWWNAANHLITTAGDYARFVVSVMRRDGEAIEFGWRRVDFPDGPVFTYTGLNDRPGGERTLAYFEPRRQHGVVILTSGAEGERLYREIAALIDPMSVDLFRAAH